MEQTGATRSFAVPVFFLLAGVLLALLAIAWWAFGTGPFIDDGLSTPESSRPWLPATAGVLALASLWWGFRKLREPISPGP
jgi:hypothetical protein